MDEEGRAALWRVQRAARGLAQAVFDARLAGNTQAAAAVRAAYRPLKEWNDERRQREQQDADHEQRA